jgi:sec-independent protein translocase protein TatA
MFSGFGLTELLVILAIVLLIFGPKRLKSLGSDLGSAIKGFRTAVSDDENKEKTTDPQQEKVIEGEVNSTESATTETKQNTNA